MKKILEDLVLLGVVKEPIKLFNREFIMQTLTTEEHIEATNATGDFDPLTRIYALKVEILGRAIKSIDGEPIENKFEMLKTLRVMQAPAVHKLYENFEKLQIKQGEALSDFEQLKN